MSTSCLCADDMSDLKPSQPILPLRRDVGDGVLLSSSQSMLTSATLIAGSLACKSSAVVFGLVSRELVEQSVWAGRLNVLVQTVGGSEGL